MFDEVITGFRAGITGAQGIYDVMPDITILGKALGGGALPISAVLASRAIMSHYQDGKVIFAGTFNGYALGLAAVKANLSILKEDEDAYPRMKRHMESISELLIKAGEDHGIPMVVQGIPNALTFHPSDHPVDSFEEWTNEHKMMATIIRETCKRFGIQFCPLSRMYSNIMLNERDVEFFESRIGPAMAASKIEIDKTFDQFEQFGLR